MNYILDRDYARELLEWANELNQGPWFNHLVNVAKATENILLELNKNGHDLNVLHWIGKGFNQLNMS